MPPEILALLDKPHLMVGVLAVGALFGIIAEQFMSALRRQAWRRKNRSGWDRRRGHSFPKRPWPSPRGLAANAPDAADQLRIFMAAEFTVQPLLNASEARVFKALDRAVLARNPAWQVMAQVSLGEVLQSEDGQAYRCINSKRVDLLLMEERCQPRHAIEYQGGGHHQGAAAARDAVKKEALRRAGVGLSSEALAKEGYHEVVAGQTTPAELRRLVERLVDWPT